MADLNKKVILITGCSSGFGLLTALCLAQSGHWVIATMRNLKKKDALLSEARKRNCTVDLMELDVIKPETIERTVKTVEEKYQRLDVLVNNAGYGIGGYFEDLSDGDIRDQMETNFFGVLNVTRTVLPLMRKQKSGTIINISSIAGLISTPSFSAYNASKWALEGFFESLSYELKEFGIHVALIEPGVYKTNIFHQNAHYAARFDDPKSPYYNRSQFLRKRILDMSNNCIRDPQVIARLIERIINTKNPRLRYIPDVESRLRFCLKKILPFKLYSFLTHKVIFAGFKRKN